MSESKQDKVLRLLKTKLPNSRADGESEDPTTRASGNGFALLGIPEDTRSDQVPGLASKSRSTASEVLRTILKGDSDAALICSEFSTRFSQAAERLDSAAKADAHRADLRSKRLAALGSYAGELALAGAAEPARALFAKAERLGFARSDRESAVREVLREGENAAPHKPDQPTRTKPVQVRVKVGLMGILDFAPLAVGAAVTALIFAALLGHYALPKLPSLPADPRTIPTGLGSDPPESPEDLAGAGARVPSGTSRSVENRPPVLSDVLIDTDLAAELYTVRIVAKDPEGEPLQYFHRVPAKTKAWVECDAKTDFPIGDVGMLVEFQAVDAGGRRSSVVSRYLPDPTSVESKQ